jgi:hypothetical protein
MPGWPAGEGAGRDTGVVLPFVLVDVSCARKPLKKLDPAVTGPPDGLLRAAPAPAGAADPALLAALARLDQAARAGPHGAAGSGCRHARSTRRSRPPGPGRRPRRAGGSSASAEASRALSRRVCAPSACAGRATAAWPRPRRSTSPPPRPWTPTGSGRGSPSARSRLRGSLASPRSPPDQRLSARSPTPRRARLPMVRDAPRGRPSPRPRRSRHPW